MINPTIRNSIISNIGKHNFLPPNKPIPKPSELVYIPDGFIKQEICGSYSDFMTQLKKYYPNMSLKKLALKTKWFSNSIGEGRESIVYDIPNIDDYCIKIKKDAKLGLFKKTKPLQETKNDFYGLNFGQPIADNGEGISILLKTKGETYGIKDWIKCYSSQKTPTQAELDKYVNEDMARLSEFPQSSFDDFMKRVSLIKNVSRRHLDFFNPNNFIIDYKNKKINVVDVGRKTSIDFDILPMEAGLCDRESMHLASPETMVAFEKYAKIITEKCELARKKYLNSFPERK